MFSPGHEFREDALKIVTITPHGWAPVGSKSGIGGWPDLLGPAERGRQVCRMSLP